MTIIEGVYGTAEAVPFQNTAFRDTAFPDNPPEGLSKVHRHWRNSSRTVILERLHHLNQNPGVMSEARRLKVWRIRLLMFLAVIGPGFITANVDNDAGGIYTYSAAGAQFGY